MNEAIKNLKLQLAEHRLAAGRIERALEVLGETLGPAVLKTNGHPPTNGHTVKLNGAAKTARKRRYKSAVSPSTMILEELTDGQWHAARYFHNRGVKPSVISSTLGYLLESGKIQRRGEPYSYEYALSNGKG